MNTLPRCPWAVEPSEYRRYHDEEWGRPVVDDTRIFEKLCLEAFQAGLSWLTILRKREAFRTAFSSFDVEAVAGFGEADVARLLADTGIVRNRAKIEAALANARATLDLQASGASLASLLWRFEPRTGPVPRTVADIPAVTPESTALSKELRRRGFRFLGPTTVYAVMQSLGVVNDHVETCFVREPVEAERRVLLRPLSGARPPSR